MMVAMGGSSANIAAGLVKLGCKAALVTKVSDDAVGWYCLNQLDHYGVDRSHVQKIKGEYRTSLAVYETRVEEHQSVIYRNNAADFQMDLADVEAVDYTELWRADHRRHGVCRRAVALGRLPRL
jgi:5-dehydro-2-deoxygluconokinase